ncbi:MAG: hypothetical protein H0W98_03310 [Chloroflexi bacterium]|nr:hypothetical protein [Chloroflexota bacterium]
MRRHLERPETSTRNEWLVVGALIGIVLAIVLSIGWLLASVVNALVSAIG